nr:MAG: replication associated protein [Arizlama virus]
MTSYSGRTTDSRSRNWCFTLNNYTDEDIDKLVNSSYKYLIIGKEVAPTTNTPHLQGFIIFPNARRLSTLKADYNKTTHWEIARGTPEQNIEYCSKSGGEKNKEKWALAKANAKLGLLDEVPDDIFIMHYSTIKAIAKDYMTKPLDLPPGKYSYWYYGKTRRGKTHAALEDFPNAYRKISNNKWWDGYQGEDNVIIDDLDKKHDYMGYHLKIWGDRYAFIVETKGSSQYIRPKQLCVTSNYHPKDIWQDETTLEPILARFNVVQFCYEHETPLDHGLNEEVRTRMLDVPPPVVPPNQYATNFIPPL